MNKRKPRWKPKEGEMVYEATTHYGQPWYNLKYYDSKMDVMRKAYRIGVFHPTKSAALACARRMLKAAKEEANAA